MNLSSPEFTGELHHLFGTPPGRVPGGKPDYGFNCYAKAFVVMYICRLRGMAVDVCLGKLFIMQKNIPEQYMAVVEPHAWVASPKHRVIDLSIVNFQGHPFLPVLHDNVPSQATWVVGTTLKEACFQKILRNFRSLPKDSYILYHLEKNRLFVFDDICRGGRATNSPPTKALTDQYGDNNVLAKSILHLHLVLEGNRTPLGPGVQHDAWDTLAGWNIDAVDQLRSLMPSLQE